MIRPPRRVPQRREKVHGWWAGAHRSAILQSRMDPELTDEVAEIITPRDSGPPGSPGGDQRIILGNTAQNVVGLGIGAVATFAAQALMTNRLGDDSFSVVTLTTQFAFIAAAATRFGMDVANVRLVAILVGRDEAARSRGLVRRAVGIAAAVSLPFAASVWFASGWLADAFSGLPAQAEPAFRAAAATIPFAALAFTYMGATRGLKIMRYTLFSQWIGQPIGWIVFTLVFWAVAASTASVASWAFGCLVGTGRRHRGLGLGEGEAPVHRRHGSTPADGITEERTGALVRFGALRAPATLFSQLIFWADFFVASALFSPLGRQGSAEVGIYGGVLRAGQSLFLFLTSVSLTFSPFVADLHHRGEHEQLDGLYKQVTRWTLAATIPVLLVLAVLPAQVLRVFGPSFVAGAGELRILIVGMIVPVMVGTVGFILIMAGRTGWDLMVYVGGFAIDVGLALALARPEVLGIRGAAIAQAATLTISALARLFLVRRFLRIWPFDGWYLRLLMPTVVGGAAMYAAHMVVPDARWLVNLVLAAAIGTAVYVVPLARVRTAAQRTCLDRARSRGSWSGRRLGRPVGLRASPAAGWGGRSELDQAPTGAGGTSG